MFYTAEVRVGIINRTWAKKHSGIGVSNNQVQSHDKLWRSVKPHLPSQEMMNVLIGSYSPDVFSEVGMAGLREKKEKTPLNLRLRSGSATPFTRTRSGYSFYPDGAA
jgi:hypothetical protein